MDSFDELYSPAPKPGSGRPTLYSQELADQICELVAEGKSLRRICRDAAMPAPTTIKRWLLDADKQGFKAQYHAAYKLQMLGVFDELKDLVDDCDVAEITKVREQLKLRQWLLKIHEPKKYGDRPEPQVVVATDMDLTKFNDEQLALYIELQEIAKRDNAE